MKQYYCLLKKFNNYFNRKVIKYETLSDYQDNSEAFFIPETTEGGMKPFDFNPSDNVTTEIIVNDVPFDPDYFLLLDEKQNIVQRWYVLEQKRNRQGQWQYFLRRDVISDHINSLLTAPVFVEKAWLKDDNPLLLNSEGMNFNKIKTSETLLKDFSNSAWYVAYLSKNKGGVQIDLQLPSEDISDRINLSDIATALDMSEADLANYLCFNGDLSNPTRFIKSFAFYCYVAADIWNELDVEGYASWNYKIDDSSCAWDSWWNSDADVNPLFRNSGDDVASYLLFHHFKQAVSEFKAQLLAEIPQIFKVDKYITLDHLNILKSYEAQGKPIYYLGRYYQLRLVSVGSDAVFPEKQMPAAKYSSMYDIAARVSELAGSSIRLNSAGTYSEIRTDADKYVIQLNEISDDPSIPVMELEISSSRKQTLDQQYDIICFPADNIEFEYEDENNEIQTFTSLGDVCRRMVAALAIQEDANVYDVQLLPYCPLSEITELQNKTEHEDYDFIVDNNNPPNIKGVVFYIPYASFMRNLNYSLSIVESMKVDNECDMYRIIAPNYQGTFEFNVAKNGGSVDSFIAYCTYKPYTPFIKVTPNFNYMYGMDYNDNRGLICSGDFSMPRINSAWESYQLQNKNYQNIFNREIQNLDIMQGIESRQQQITGGLGIVTDAIKGGIAGGMVGGGWGAAAGAAIGGAASFAGYEVDKTILAIQHREQRSIAIDKFNYQLGNIKALPYSITKVGAFDISSKVFPVLEYYTCTEEEKNALVRKLQYESMTVMAIDEFGNYYKTFDDLKYFKGQLIRCDDIAEDNHMLEAIYAEILKGVYM